MPGISEGIPGAKAFDEVLEQDALIGARDANKGKPPVPRILVEPEDANDFRTGVLTALGIGRNVTHQS